jgi:hypothetical protein
VPRDTGAAADSALWRVGSAVGPGASQQQQQQQQQQGQQGGCYYRGPGQVYYPSSPVPHSLQERPGQTPTSMSPCVTGKAAAELTFATQTLPPRPATPRTGTGAGTGAGSAGSNAGLSAAASMLEVEAHLEEALERNVVFPPSASAAAAAAAAAAASRAGAPPDSVIAVCWRASEDNEEYTGPAPIDELAKRIAAARGMSGPNVDYLVNLAKSLHALGVPDLHADLLCARVAYYRKQGLLSPDKLLQFAPPGVDAAAKVAARADV